MKRRPVLSESEQWQRDVDNQKRNQRRFKVFVLAYFGIVPALMLLVHIT